MTSTVTQAQVTSKGRELADKLAPAIGWTREIEQTCSLICRHATTHHAYMEAACNRQLTTWDEERIEQLEARITWLVDYLPTTEEGPFVAYFQGDARGATVKIMVKGHERHELYDGFALEAIIVPTR
jgi:hypothetical protein